MTFPRERHHVVLDAEGRRVWGRPDAVFTDGLPAYAVPDDDAQFVGVHRFDDVVGRRPSPRPIRLRRRRRARSGLAARAAVGCVDVSRLVFPHGEPADLPATLESGGERMNMAWAVGVLMDNRDMVRRLAAEPALAL